MNTEKVTAFFDHAAPNWDNTCPHDGAKIKKILEYAGINESCTVLDVACGTGALFPFYLERGVKKIIGVDLSSGMIAQAKAKFNDTRIQLIVGDAAQVPLDNYDCCVVYSALPHFENPSALIEKLSRHLAPGGRFTVAHSDSKETINHRHENDAKEVSMGLISAEELALLFEPFFDVDVLIDDDEMYVVSGSKKKI